MPDGTLFDLGGITLEAIPVKGHTEGSTAVLLKEWEILISGDCCNNNTLLYRLTVKEFGEELKRKLAPRKSEWKEIYVLHGMVSTLAPINLIDEMIEICEKISDGSIIGSPLPPAQDQGFNKGKLSAYPRNIMAQRIDGGFTNLLYYPDNIK